MIVQMETYGKTDIARLENNFMWFENDAKSNELLSVVTSCELKFGSKSEVSELTVMDRKFLPFRYRNFLFYLVYRASFSLS